MRGRTAGWIVAIGLLGGACRTSSPGAAPESDAGQGELRVHSRVQEAAGDLDGARATQERLLARLLETRPEDATEVQLARLDLARTLARLGAAAGARSLRARACDILERRLGTGHPLVQRARLDLAASLFAAGDARGAAGLAADAVAALATLPAGHAELRAARPAAEALLEELAHAAVEEALAARLRADLERVRSW